jgi:predicted dehydrogenase
MTMRRSVRWGILGTAKIARNLFLPSLREAGGDPAAVAGRDADRTARWASANGIGRAITGYQDLIDDPGIDALYIPLPNALHGEWTIIALEAGKPVLCEKPLTGSAAQTERVMARLRGILTAGTIGDLREIQSGFHFAMSDPDTNVRMFAELEGGALLDLGCYPVRLGRDLFGAEHEAAWAQAEFAPGGVDLATWGCLNFPGGRHLYLSCGFRRSPDTFTRLLGTGGQIHVTNPFHPRAGDTFTVCQDGRAPVTHRGIGPYRRSFTPLIRHIHGVIRDEQEPRLLAVDTALGSARALHDLAASSRQQA